MAILVQDNFTDTNGVLLQNHTPDIGAAWVKISGGDAEIQSNELDTGSAAGPYYYNAIADTTDVYTQIKRTSFWTRAVMLIARYVDANNYYFYAETGGLYSGGLYKMVAGVATALDAYPFQLADGEIAKFTVIGTTLELYVDDVLKATGTDSTFTTGKVGLGCSGHSQQFDDFEAGTPEAPVAPNNLTAICIKEPVPSIPGFTITFG